MLKMIKKSKKGFTLTELIVVIAILGVLAAVVTPSVLGYLGDAQESADAANLATLDSCVKRLVAKGTLNLVTNNDFTNAAHVTAVINAIRIEVDIPAVNDTVNNSWCLTKTVDGEGRVTAVRVTQVPAGVTTADVLFFNNTTT